MRAITEQILRPEIMIALDTSGSMVFTQTDFDTVGTDCGGDRKAETHSAADCDLGLCVDACGDGHCSGSEDSGACPADCAPLNTFNVALAQPLCVTTTPSGASRFFMLKRVLRNVIPSLAGAASFGLATFYQTGYFTYGKSPGGATAWSTIFLSEAEIKSLSAWDTTNDKPQNTFYWDGVSTNTQYTLLSATPASGTPTPPSVKIDSLYVRVDNLAMEKRLNYASCGHRCTDANGINWDYRGSFYSYIAAAAADNNGASEKVCYGGACFGKTWVDHGCGIAHDHCTGGGDCYNVTTYYVANCAMSSTYKGPQYVSGADTYVYVHDPGGGWSRPSNMVRGSYPPDGNVLLPFKEAQDQTTMDGHVGKLMARFNTELNGGLVGSGGTPTGPLLGLVHQAFKHRQAGACSDTAALPNTSSSTTMYNYQDAATNCPYTAIDPAAACRKRYVLLLTDGQPTDGDTLRTPETAAQMLYNETAFAGNPIQTIVVGVPGLPGTARARLMDIADYGTDGVKNNPACCCQMGAVTKACTVGGDCASGTCGSYSTHEQKACNQNGDCASGSCGSYSTHQQKTCNNNSECASNSCGSYVRNTRKACTNGGQCASGTCSSSKCTVGSQAHCNTDFPGLGYTYQAGSPGKCYYDGKCGCSTDAHCASDGFSGTTCNSGKCDSDGKCNCTTNAHCTADGYAGVCNGATHQCDSNGTCSCGTASDCTTDGFNGATCVSSQCTYDCTNTCSAGVTCQSAYFANDESSLAQSIQDAIYNAIQGDYTTTQPGIHTSGTTQGDTALLASTEFPGWRGHLRAWDLLATPPSIKWDAGELLSSTNRDYKSRYVYTGFGPTPIDLLQDHTTGTVDTAGLAAEWAKITPAPSYTPTTSELDAFANWLLGATRDWRLDSILHSNPATVGPPPGYSTVSGHAGYETAYASREQLAYVTSNDGLIHAFRLSDSNGSGSAGTEAFAYLPPNLMPTVFSVWKSGGQMSAPGQFRWVLAQSPRVEDLPCSSCTPNPWQTQLVLSGGPGSASLLALDISNPSTCSAGTCTLNATPFTVLVNSNGPNSSSTLAGLTTGGAPTMGEGWSIPALFYGGSGATLVGRAAFGSGYGTGTRGEYYNFIDSLWTYVSTDTAQQSSTGAIETPYAVMADTVAVINESNSRKVVVTYQADMKGRIQAYNQGAVGGPSTIINGGAANPFYLAPAAYLDSGTVTIAANSGYVEEAAPTAGTPGNGASSTVYMCSGASGTSCSTDNLSCSLSNSCATGGTCFSSTISSCQNSGGSQNAPGPNALPVSQPLIVDNATTGAREAFFLYYEKAGGVCSGGTSWLLRVRATSGVAPTLAAVNKIAGRASGMGLAANGQAVIVNVSGKAGQTARPALGAGVLASGGTATGAPTIEAWREVR